MPSDARAQQAREAHAASLACIEEAARHRDRRDQAIRRLRAEDPKYWTHARLAQTVQCSEELIAHVLRGGTRDRPRARRRGARD